MAIVAVNPGGNTPNGTAIHDGSVRFIKDSIATSTWMISLIVDGFVWGSWSEVSGIKTAQETIDYHPSRESVTELLNRYAWVRTPVTIKLTGSSTINAQFSAWGQQASWNPIKPRKNCTIHLMDYQGSPIAAWHFEKAWPSKIEGPTIDSKVRRASSGTVSLTCDFIRKA